MKINLYTILFFVSFFGNAQKDDVISKKNNFIIPEIFIGKTHPANNGFPETKLNKGISFHIGNHQQDNTQEWAYRLRFPKTGIVFTFTDYGNPSYVGYSFSLMPFLEYGFFKKTFNHRLNMNIGLGTSYFTEDYSGLPYSYNNIIENNNRAISTKLAWSFKAFLYYDLLKRKKADWRLGVGFHHQSNGHTSLPNQGLNSFLFSISRLSRYSFQQKNTPAKRTYSTKNHNKSIQNYFSFRTGIGVNVLSESFNDKKPVYSLAASYGKIFNRTFKIGLGFYYRYYESFSTYIEDGEELIIEQYPHFQENSYKYSTSYGVFISSEILLGHVGIEVDLGYNFYKPFYEVEWKLQQGFYWDFYDADGTYETRYVYGELNTKYELKKAILSRLGIKYYLFNNNNNPSHNVFLGATINANLGQADFSEFNVGYVYRFGLKLKK